MPSIPQFEYSPYTATWTWTPPALDDNEIIYFYELYVNATPITPDGSAYSFSQLVGTLGTFSHPVTNGYAYTLSVAAANAAGTGRYASSEELHVKGLHNLKYFFTTQL